MKIFNSIQNGICAIDKAHGFSTHEVSANRPGIKELLERELGQSLFICQRLDKNTSGVLLFPTSAEKCKELSEWFEQKKVQKKYLFITDKTWDAMEAHCTEEIEGKSAETFFRRIKSNPRFALWEAHPKTGRTHQIRLHAKALGIPILGDVTYGGAPFPRICLHAQELSLPNGEKFTSPAPLFFERLHLLLDPKLSRWLVAIDQRMRLFHFRDFPEATLRLIHHEDSQMRLDLLGEVLWFYDYSEDPLSKKDMERVNYIARGLNKTAVVRKMNDRGENPAHEKIVWSRGESVENWQARENNVLFEFRPEQGMSPGLFLDQRKNRERVLLHARDKKVLNLFSYTCGFSVCAALGGATKVTSVDTSIPFLEWGKKNFSINGIDPSQHEFFRADSGTFLDGALKHSREFDLIILDPPTFSRSPKGVFRFEKDISDLLKKCHDLLSAQGEMLLSTNFEKWDEQKLQAVIQNALPGCKLLMAAGPLDFDTPDNAFEGPPPLTKYIWIAKGLKSPSKTAIKGHDKKDPGSHQQRTQKFQTRRK